jgi:hypothetical protein
MKYEGLIALAAVAGIGTLVYLLSKKAEAKFSNKKVSWTDHSWQVVAYETYLVYLNTVGDYIYSVADTGMEVGTVGTW